MIANAQEEWLDLSDSAIRLSDKIRETLGTRQGRDFLTADARLHAEAIATLLLRFARDVGTTGVAR